MVLLHNYNFTYNICFIKLKGDTNTLNILVNALLLTSPNTSTINKFSLDQNKLQN